MHGGKREGAGRKKQEPTVRIRVPESQVEAVRAFMATLGNDESVIRGVSDEIRPDNQVIAVQPVKRLPSRRPLPEFTQAEINALSRSDRRSTLKAIKQKKALLVS